MEGKGLEIVDSLLGEAYPAHEVLRCVHIGLLCVQEQATDRPNMPEIVFMLGNETTLPPPNKPTFINRRIINSGQDSSSSAGAPASINNVTISVLEARWSLHLIVELHFHTWTIPRSSMVSIYFIMFQIYL